MKDDTFTSIHIEDFDVEIRETKLGREEFTRDIPNVSEKPSQTSMRTASFASELGSVLATSCRQGFAQEQERIDPEENCSMPSSVVRVKT